MNDIEIDVMLELVQENIDEAKEHLKADLSITQEQIDSYLDIWNCIYSTLERSKRTQEILDNLNKGFVDKETGKTLTGVTPYVLSRAKHNMKLISEEAQNYKAKLDAFPLKLWDTFGSGDAVTAVDAWIESAGIRPRKPTKNENFA